ncbi:predicted protein [Nematostella vectensis]|uniref:YqaJ viral recombinase domain-containing protein n=1 Tax=Nematostella vectensis TaxID=45351 RepID=A7STK0_NEMVE|nr:predicted protein [Nematostella vectensis]|eukprot:XP_001625057.1 predicted protein [Nematostella vectensis]
MTDKPFKNGRKYVESGFVHDMVDARNNDLFRSRSSHSGAVIHATSQPCKVSALGRCSHVVAVLLALDDYAKDHGCKTNVSCTSTDCSWNKGKKRTKNPQRLSLAKYPTKKKQEKISAIDFAPRPLEYRSVKKKNINNFVTNLQMVSSKTHESLFMWETQLKIEYNDYRLEDDEKALLVQQTDKKVIRTGFWVNPKFPFLGCSPDGLIDEDGLLEIKSLKIFKQHTIEEVVQGGSNALPKETLDRQCFTIDNGKCVLKTGHIYYYQIQMQLLVIEKRYCDFILYAHNGPVSIERVFIAPEVFTMRVPRDLLPFIMPSPSFHPQGPPGSPLPLPHSPPSQPSSPFIQPGSPLALPPSPPPLPLPSNPLPLPSSPLPLPSSSFIQPGSPLPPSGSPLTQPDIRPSGTQLRSHSNEEVEVANLLVNQSKIIQSGTAGLITIPWGGISSSGILLSNTCPLDNWLMIIQVLVKSGKLELENLRHVGDKYFWTFCSVLFMTGKR